MITGSNVHGLHAGEGPPSPLPAPEPNTDSTWVRLSILMPVRNGDKYLIGALESLAA